MYVLCVSLGVWGMDEIKLRHFPLLDLFPKRELKNPNFRYIKIGYQNEMDYYKGVSMFNRNHFGWNGFTKTNATLGSVEGMKDLRSFILHKNF